MMGGDTRGAPRGKIPPGRNAGGRGAASGRADREAASPRQVLLGLQRTAGNRAAASLVGQVQRRAAAPAPAAGPATDHLDGLVIDAAIAFQELGGQAHAGAALPGAPAAFRPGLQHLQSAKQHLADSDKDVALAAVAKRMVAEGAPGLAKMVLIGSQLVLEERLQRAYAAKTEWQAARPVLTGVIARYSKLNAPQPAVAGVEVTTVGAEGRGQAQKVEQDLRAVVARMDEYTTAQIPDLHNQLLAVTTPDQAEKAKAVAEAKQALGVMENVLAQTKPLFQTLSAVAKGKELMDGPYLKAVEGYTKVKAFVGIAESAATIKEALGKLADKNTSGWEIGKAYSDITSAILTPVNEAGALVLQAAAYGYEAHAARLMKGVSGKGQLLQPALKSQDVAKRLRGYAKSLGALEKVTGVLSILTAGLGAVEGFRVGDAEAAIGGVLDTAEAGVSLAGTFGETALGQSAQAIALPVMIGVAQVKTFLQVVAQMSRSLQTIQNRAMREAVGSIAKELTAAGRLALAFDEAVAQSAWRLSATDDVERRLGEQFARNALEQVPPLHDALGWALNSAVHGGISDHPVLSATFAEAFGGHGRMAAIRHEISASRHLSSPGDLAAHGERLKEMIPLLSEAVGQLNLTMDAMARDAKGALRFSSADENSLKLRTHIYFGNVTGGAFLSEDPRSFALDSPIRDAKYRSALEGRLRGKGLGAAHGLQIEIRSEIFDKDIVLTGSDGDLHRHAGLTENATKALHDLARKDGAAGEPSQREVAEALWRLHMRTVKVSERASFAS